MLNIKGENRPCSPSKKQGRDLPVCARESGTERLLKEKRLIHTRFMFSSISSTCVKRLKDLHPGAIINLIFL